MVWAPSVGPGYIDDRASPGNTTPTLGRDNGATYDRQRTNALATKPTWVSITSFNEWHEGSAKTEFECSHLTNLSAGGNRRSPGCLSTAITLCLSS
ncbi:hypothetical protein [Dactylosporangium sp. NPDC048998]|uniref:hypothetical protein n=1 Tax=Dactylosporangium sp. NPDC048998 TaxID=3363976 RepID=UPI0037240829